MLNMQSKTFKFSDLVKLGDFSSEIKIFFIILLKKQGRQYSYSRANEHERFKKS